MNRKTTTLALNTLIGIALASSFPVLAASAVKVSEQNVVIPTYEAGPPEPNPMFYFGRQSQGAQAPVYPYPMYDVLTGKKADKTYKMVWIENEYIRIGILPEIGGRIFEAVDKTDNYNFIYRQHVIKPALISIIGAWISGGVEWNIPHHHRASTFLPVQYSVEDNADGSKTVWVGELELRQRMRWAVGYTVWPGNSRLEASLRILNRTPEANTMLSFANVAVHVNNDYQIIFPPSTQYGTGHSKRVFQTWPISESGTDISWWKNHPGSTSVFAWNYEDDFFAGYDHGKQAGIMSVADHNVVPGKKFFTWGTNTNRSSWYSTLTDDDGPYIELMAGAYSDNQPDYSWLQPYEGRSFSMNWYPFRDIGGVKNANLDAAVNLDVTNGIAKVGFYTTAAHAAAKVVFRAGQKVLLQESIAISPAKPFVRQIPVPAGLDLHDLVASITDGGQELVSYSPIRLKPEPMPQGVTAPPAPTDVKSNEELYLIGLRAQQFHDPIIAPEPYWEEALRRDPGDARVNTVLGVTAYSEARYEEAEKYLRKALERLTDRYTSPKDVEANYYLGAVLKAQGKTDEAYTQFFKATWGEAWKAAAYYSLAEIATGRGDLKAALELTERAVDSNALNIRAQNLKAALLRHLGRSKEAQEVLASAAHNADPLDVRAMAERWLASKSSAAAKTMAATMNAHPATAQETAAEYLDAGLWQDGLEVLLQVTASAPDKSKIHPMVYYYLGYFATKLGQPQKASEYYRLAMTMPSDYVFPFQNEAIDVLRQAMKANPRDSLAPYYLGNLLYDWQPEEAAKLWEASAALDPSLPVVHRNLATAYTHRKSESDLNKAIAELEKAVSFDRKYAMHFKELDELYEQAGTPIEKRLPLFEKNQEIVAQRDDAQNRAIALKVAGGKYDEAIKMMTGRKFAVAEGANLNVGEHWTDAHIFRGQQNLAAKRYQEALADFQTAVTMPTNLPSGGGGGGGGGGGRSAELAYWTGMTYEAMGDHDKATQSWSQTSATPQAGGRRGGAGGAGRGGGARGGGGGRGGFGGAAGGGAQSYYQALCVLKLGDADKAKTMFQSLVESGQSALDQPATVPTGGRRGGRGGMGRAQAPRLQTASAHYTIGLGYLGLSDLVKAKAELTQAVDLNPDLVGARVTLAALKYIRRTGLAENVNVNEPIPMSLQTLKLWRTCPSILVLLAALLPAPVRGADEPRKLVFDGVLCEHKLALKDLAPSLPADWSGYTHLVMEMRTSSPQRFGLWAYTADGPRRIEIQPFGQNVWLRASVPLQYFIGMDQSGTDLASTINRRTASFWMSVWGPFGELKSVEAIGFAMQYPIHKPTIELRNVHLAKQDEGSQFLEGTPVADEFGQWAHVDYPRKIKSAEQLTKELTAETAALGTGADFGYCEFGGYKSTQAKATGFFHVEQIDGKWWFVDPHGHLFLSMGVNGATGGGGRGGGGRGGTGRSGVGPSANAPSQARRLEAWGMTMGGQGRPTIPYFRVGGNRGTTFLGLSDVYDTNFVSSVDQQANTQCSPQKDNPLILGYFLGNEPPWGDRESEVVDMILKGPDTGTKVKLKEFLAQGDTPKRRKQFVVTAFEYYLTTICSAVKKYDPNHLILGIRFGGKPADEVMRLGRLFDVCSINVYEYEPTKQVDRAYRLSGRPVLIGEFHIGVPENGLGSGLVQAMNQTERGIAYRYYVEQAASLDGFLGAHWFQWQDEGVTGRMDGENYNIGFVDSTNRPYPELVEAAKATHKRLLDVHSGKILPFSQKPKASEAGAPSSPWD